MSEFASFLPPELADIGLVAFADPSFAERLVDALLRLPPERVVDARPLGKSEQMSQPDRGRACRYGRDPSAQALELRITFLKKVEESVRESALGHAPVSR